MNRAIEKWMRCLVVGLGVASIAALTGCQCMETTSAPASSKDNITVGKGCPAVATKAGTSLVRQAFPSGHASNSLILLESSSPAEVMVGEEFDYTIDVTNLTDCPLYDVEVSEDMKKNHQLQSSDPQATVRGNTVTWDLGTLPARDTKTVTALVKMDKAGAFEHCAKVDYDLAMCQTTVVVAPELQAEKTLPESVILCDAIPMDIVVSNAGTGTIADVTVTDELPDGLTTAAGEQVVSYQIPSLDAGQTVARQFQLKATRTGTFSNTVVAKSDTGMEAKATAKVDVRQPVLALSKTATDTQFAGRMIDYEITVSNTGNAPAEDVRVVDNLPNGVEFRKASDNGVFEKKNNRIAWRLASLGMDKKRTLKATVRAMQAGTAQNQVGASAVCAEPVSATASTEITGVPAVLLEVIDIDDPIEVGGTETYRITVTNQGTAMDTNIAISCTLHSSQSFISAGGATEAEKTGKKVVFKPLAELGPKKRATWTVRAKADKASDARFSVEMRTGQLGDQPVIETEATNQY